MRDSRKLPDHLVEAGASPVFTRETAPEAIKEKHSTAAGRWAVLKVHAGELSFIDLARGERVELRAGDEQVIAPTELHRVDLVSPVEFQLTFYHEGASANSA